MQRSAGLCGTTKNQTGSSNSRRTERCGAVAERMIFKMMLQVPVVSYGGEFLYESNIINEYLDEAFPGFHALYTTQMAH